LLILYQNYAVCLFVGMLVYYNAIED